MIKILIGIILLFGIIFALEHIYQEYFKTNNDENNLNTDKSK